MILSIGDTRARAQLRGAGWPDRCSDELENLVESRGKQELRENAFPIRSLGTSSRVRERVPAGEPPALRLPHLDAVFAEAAVGGVAVGLVGAVQFEAGGLFGAVLVRGVGDGALLPLDCCGPIGRLGVGGGDDVEPFEPPAL